MLDLSAEQLVEVKTLLADRLPANSAVYAFGSRTQNKARKFSDLDLLIKPSAQLDYAELATLEEAFSESSLPFRTDIVDWYRISDEFRQVIEPQAIQIL